MRGEPFTLDTDYRPKRQKVKGENNPNTRQSVLFSGMDLLPGQQDLFATDGRESSSERFCALCDQAVNRPDVTPCGMYHPACAEKHAAECQSCQRDYYPL